MGVDQPLHQAMACVEAPRAVVGRGHMQGPAPWAQAMHLLQQFGPHALALAIGIYKQLVQMGAGHIQHQERRDLWPFGTHQRDTGRTEFRTDPRLPLAGRSHRLHRWIGGAPGTAPDAGPFSMVNVSRGPRTGLQKLVCRAARDKAAKEAGRQK